MSIWMFRAGASGEFESKFLNDNRVYLTWEGLDIDLRSFQSKEELYKYLLTTYSLDKNQKAINWGSQIWPIAHRVQKGDWVILPSKVNRTIHIGEIVGDYVYDTNLGSPYYHYRDVIWFALEIPRDKFEQDILYSLGAFMTVCRIHRNNAESRIKKMQESNWNVPNEQIKGEDDDEATDVDLEEFIFDKISEHIIRKFQGSKLELLIEEILKAKGFTTYRSPEGVDHGVDLLASPDTLGFGSPKICVQVKATDSPIDRPTLDQLIGTMSNFNADYGLLVSWNGFKTSVIKEIPKQFFKVRLWDSKKVIEQIFENYDKLSASIQAEIPLKRVWMLNLEK